MTCGKKREAQGVKWRNEVRNVKHDFKTFLGGGECHRAGLCGERKTWDGGKTVKQRKSMN